jgi:hypothetical protein
MSFENSSVDPGRGAVAGNDDASDVEVARVLESYLAAWRPASRPTRSGYWRSIPTWPTACVPACGCSRWPSGRPRR